MWSLPGGAEGDGVLQARRPGARGGAEGSSAGSGEGARSPTLGLAAALGQRRFVAAVKRFVAGLLSPFPTCRFVHMH